MSEHYQYYQNIQGYKEEDNNKFAKTESKIFLELNNYKSSPLTVSENIYNEKELLSMPDKYEEPKYIIKKETYTVLDPIVKEVIQLPIGDKNSDRKTNEVVNIPIVVTGNDDLPNLYNLEEQVQEPGKSYGFCFDQQINNIFESKNNSKLYKFQESDQNNYNESKNRNYYPDMSRECQKSKINKSKNINTNINNNSHDSNFLQNYYLSSQKNIINNNYSNINNDNYQLSNTDNNLNMSNGHYQSINKKSKTSKNELPQKSKKSNNKTYEKQISENRHYDDPFSNEIHYMKIKKINNSNNNRKSNTAPKKVYKTKSNTIQKVL